MPNRRFLTVPRRALTYAYPLAVLKDNPMAYIRGSDASGPTAIDSTIWKKNGTYNGAFTYRIPSAFTTDPTTGFSPNDYSAYMSLPLLSNAITNWTLEGIFKIPDALQFGGFMGVGNLTSNGWGFGVGGSNLTNAGSQLIAGVTGVNWYLSGFNLVAGTWYHIACVLTGGNILFYVQGSIVNTIAVGAMTAPTVGFLISQFNNHGPVAGYSDLAFYNYPLIAAQISSHAVLVV